MGAIYNYWKNPANSTSLSVTYTAGLGHGNGATSGTLSTVIPVSSSSRTMRLSYDTSINFNSDNTGNSYTTTIDFYTAADAFMFSVGGSWGLTNQRYGHSITVPANAAKVIVSFSLNIGYSASKPTQSRTASFTQFRLADQASNTYITGATPGYMWEGAANNSYTRLADLLAESTGTVTVTGTLVAISQPFIQLAGTVVSTGTLEAFRTGSEASGTVVGTGSIEMGPYGPAAASGTVTGGGSLVIHTLVFYELSGTVTDDGTVQAGIVFQTFADGDVTSTGEIEMTFPPDAEAIAFGTSTGTLQVAIAGVTSATGTVFSTGDIEIGQAIPAGSFTDFAIFATTETDPLMSVTAASNGGTNTGATGLDWVRIYGEFTAPSEVIVSSGTLWKRAAFAVPGIRFTALPAASWQEVTRVQAEIAGPSGPSTYIDGATLRPLVYPDRLNLAPNTISVTTASVTTSAPTATSPIAGDTAPALTVSVAPTTTAITTTLDKLRPNTTYTSSIYISPAAEFSELFFDVVDQDSSEPLGRSTRISAASQAVGFPAGWRRISCTFTAPISGATVMTYRWDFTTPQVVARTFSAAGFLVEASPHVDDYFFNPGSDVEFHYRSGFSDPSGGVWNYKDPERKAYILKQALADYVPTGIGIGDPEFDLIPHYDS